ncbi:MAG: hypothetical protein IT434_08280 [Phycisphaerales bacterium]|nr:hypothetical protein [Phycisphaerales bacterium]
MPGQTNQVSVQATIEGNLTGAVSAYRIYRIDAFGAINADVSQASTSASAVLYAIQAGADSSPNQAITSTISSAGGEIRLVSCTGDFTGSITADGSSARIAELAVQGNLTGDATKVIYAKDGTIGRINVTGYIEYALRSLGEPNIWCRYGIDSIEADSIKLAKISAEFNGNINDPNQLHNDGRIKYLTTHTGECNAIIQASTIGASSQEFGVFIAGDLTRELGYNNAGNYATNGTWLTITKPIYVGGSVNVSSGAAMTIDCGFNSIMYIDQSLYDDIHFRNACGLAGQIIINAANNSGTWASGDIVFYGRKSDSTWPETQRLQSTNPEYTQTSTDLGGGAVGVVPFKLHNNDCTPVNNASSHGWLLVTEFKRPNPSGVDPKSIKLRFYGPVRTDAAAEDEFQPVIIEQLPDGGNPIDLTESCDILVKRNSDPGWSREIEITGKEGRGFLHGIYRITPRTTGTGRLYCDQLFLETPPSVSSFTYWIDLLEDCDENGVGDLEEIDSHPWWVDFPENGRLDRCEWTGCSADVNHDGFVNGDDYDLFSDWFDTGNGNADYNYDSFVNAEDYDAFANDYESACQ